jgi:hypothetical protein
LVHLLKLKGRLNRRPSVYAVEIITQSDVLAANSTLPDAVDRAKKPMDVGAVPVDTFGSLNDAALLNATAPVKFAAPPVNVPVTVKPELATIVAFAVLFSVAPLKNSKTLWIMVPRTLSVMPNYATPCFLDLD